MTTSTTTDRANVVAVLDLLEQRGILNPGDAGMLRYYAREARDDTRLVHALRTAKLILERNIAAIDKAIGELVPVPVGVTRNGTVPPDLCHCGAYLEDGSCPECG